MSKKYLAVCALALGLAVMFAAPAQANDKVFRDWKHHLRSVRAARGL
jgi:hypothetical protein